jgi:hypothetical protein
MNGKLFEPYSVTFGRACNLSTTAQLKPLHSLPGRFPDFVAIPIKHAIC